MDRSISNKNHLFSKIIALSILAATFFSQESFAQSKFSAGAMVSTPIELFAGVNFKKFRLGLNYKNNMSGQSADPATITGQQNLSGKGTAIGLRLEYYDGKQSGGLVYRLSDSYALA